MKEKRFQFEHVTNGGRDWSREVIFQQLDCVKGIEHSYFTRNATTKLVPLKII
jgi:hypothetical protein